MVRGQLLRAADAGRRQHVRQRFHRILMEVIDALRLVRHHQRLLTQRILRRDAGRAVVGVAALRLDAADGEHKAARRIHPVGAEHQHAGDVKGADDLAAGANLDLVAQAAAHQRVMHEQQPFAQRHTHIVGEFERRGAGAAFLAVHHDKVRQNAGVQHRLDDGDELPRVADAQLETDRFAA